MPKLDGRQPSPSTTPGWGLDANHSAYPVGESFERAMALEEGADDYINKPFDPRELVARIRSVLRRARPGKPPSPRLGKWSPAG